MITILLVVAHPDDEILGFGASGKIFLKSEIKIQPVILCGNVNQRTQKPANNLLLKDILAANQTLGFEEPVLGDFPNLKMNTTPHIKLVKYIEKQIEYYEPSKVFTHHPGDLNDDHVQVSKACQAAIRLFQRRTNIKPIDEFYYMEILSSTDWSFQNGGNDFQPNIFVEVGKDGVEKKVKALSCYRDVMREFPHPRSVEAVRALATLRGAQSGYNYAEAFQLAFKRGF